MELANRFYQTSKRAELGNIIRDYALSIPPELLKGLKFAINGDMSGGKSYIWHEFQMALMGKDAALVQSEDKMGDIAFRTWSAPHVETGQSLRLHTENVNITGRFKNKAGPTIDNTAFGEPEDSVILMSNLDGKLTKNVDVLITLSVMGPSCHKNWDRFMNIDTYNQELLNAPRYNQQLIAA